MQLKVHSMKEGLLTRFASKRRPFVSIRPRCGMSLANCRAS